MAGLQPNYNLRQKRQGTEDPVKKKRTAAEYQREYRARQKNENPELYKKHLEYNNLQVKVTLANLSEEKKAMYRETTRKRVERFRAKQAELGVAQSSSIKRKRRAPPKTRVARTKQQKKWAEEKRKQREEQSVQARRRENEKRRKQYAEKKAKKRRTHDKDDDPSGDKSTPDGETNRKFLYRAVNSVEAGMPKTSAEYAAVLTRLIHKSTPRKKKHLQDNGIVSTPSARQFLAFARDSTESMKHTFSTLNRQRNKAALTRKRNLALAVSLKGRYWRGYKRNQRRFLGIGQALIKGAATVDNPEDLEGRKRRRDAMPYEVINRVKEFYHRGDISRDLPDARSAAKEGGIVKSRKVMDMSLRRAYTTFSAENPDISISISKFMKLRPRNTLTMANNKRAQCLCEYCTNVEFKLQSLSRFMAQHQLGPLTPKDKYDISRMTLCPKVDGGVYKKSCLDRQCQMCGIHLLEFDGLSQHEADPVHWFRWEIQEYNHVGSIIKRMTKVPKTSTLKRLIEELKTEMSPFSKHLFNASWQWRQYDIISKNVPPNWVVFCMDYAENYACKSQDEAQGAHWNNRQATIHPVVASYRCEEAGCSKMVTDSIFFISDDLKHCYHGVHHFRKEAIAYLEGKGIPIGKLIQFTDGAPTQYKSKVNFVDASFSLTDFGFLTEKHFFGSRHGKGPCDREIGVLKKQATLAVNAHQVEIADALGLFCFGRDNLTRPKVSEEQHVHERRNFIFVKNGDIDRERQGRVDVKPLKGTHQLHCVFPTGEPYRVSSRERSCFCIHCMTAVGECDHLDVTGEWKTSDLEKKRVNKNGTAGRVGHANQDILGAVDNHGNAR